MQVSNIKKYTNGWLVGDFIPSLFQSKDVEVGHHFINKGTKGIPHTHQFSTEFNYIIRGQLIASGHNLKEGSIFIYYPGETSNVEVLEDTDLIVIKTPSLPWDKKIVI